VGAGATSLSLSGYGLSPKLASLLATATGALTKPTLLPGRFAAHVQMLNDSLANDVQTPKPTDYAKSLFSQVTLKHYFSSAETLDALNGLNQSALQSFAASLFDSSFAEMIVMGNVDEPGALDLIQDVETKVTKSALSPEKRDEQARVNLNGVNYVLAAKHPNPQEDNGAVRLVIQLGKLDEAGAAKAEALSELVSQPFFYELRTQQQLGYIVQAAVSEDRGVSYLIFIVQSAVSPDIVTSRIHSFLETVDERIRNTTDDTFDGVVSSASAQLLEPPKKLSTVADGAWGEILDRTYRFGWSKRVAAALNTTTRDDVLAFWQNSSKLVGGGGRLLVQVYGSEHTLPNASGMPANYTAIQSIADFRSTALYW